MSSTEAMEGSGLYTEGGMLWKKNYTPIKQQQHHDPHVVASDAHLRRYEWERSRERLSFVLSNIALE